MNKSVYIYKYLNLYWFTHKNLWISRAANYKFLDPFFGK